MSERSARFVGRRQLGLEHVEARRERELRATVDAPRRASSCDSTGAVRRPDFAGESNMTSARTVSSPPAAGVDRVSKRKVRTAPGGSSPRRATTTPSPSADHRIAGAFDLVARVGDLRAIDRRAAGHVLEARGQHDHRACIADGHAADVQHGFVRREAFTARRPGSSAELNSNFTSPFGGAFWRSTKSLRHNVPPRNSANCE